MERSNAELAEEDPEDPDFKEAIAENEVILVTQRYKIQQCEVRLQQLGGDGVPHDAAGNSRLPDDSTSLAPEIGAGGQAAAPPIVQSGPVSELQPELEPEPAAAVDEGLYL